MKQNKPPNMKHTPLSDNSSPGPLKNKISVWDRTLSDNNSLEQEGCALIKNNWDF